MVYREITNTSTRPRHILECLSACPTIVLAYVAMHVDTIAKLLNHLLCFMLMCDVLVFLASWNVSFLPGLGFNTVLLAFLLCAQTITVWLILHSNNNNNNNRFSALSFLAPTDFMVGIAFGITVGAAILAFVLSTTFRGQCTTTLKHHHAPYRDLNDEVEQNENEEDYDRRRYHQRRFYDYDEHNTTNATTTLAPTSSNTTSGQEQHKSINYYDDYPVGNYACLERRGSVNAIWFWSGLLVWLNFACCLLLAIGRAELAQSTRGLYEEVGTLEDDYEDAAVRSRNQDGAITSTTPAATTTFPGDFPINGGGGGAGMNGTTADAPSSSPSWGGGAAYMGEYSSVPEIRGDASQKR
jgi:hypothetical protein